MNSNVTVGRRSLLTCVGTAVTVCLHGGARSERVSSEPGGSHASPEGQSVTPEDPSVTPEGRFPATVDRIVDTDHVVLLVEARGEVVAQYDVARTTLPAVWEGDRLLVTVEDAALTAVRTEGGTRRRIDRVRPTATAW